MAVDFDGAREIPLGLIELLLSGETRAELLQEPGRFDVPFAVDSLTDIFPLTLSRKIVAGPRSILLGATSNPKRFFMLLGRFSKLLSV